VTILGDAQSYEELRHGILEHNDPDHGRFVRAFRRYAQVCSSGEFRLLLADSIWLKYADSRLSYPSDAET
jgi:hypothetical protein